MQQIPLPVELRPEADFAEYLAGPNGEALTAIIDWAGGRRDPFLYLFGPSGTGKTHLLQAACRSAARTPRSVFYLPLAHPGLDASALDDLEQAAIVALDDVHRIAGNPIWERALFDLYNRLFEAGRRLLVSADTPPVGLPLNLPDLRSRLASGPTYRLQPLTEADCRHLLQLSAARRGLDLPGDAVDYIMNRCPRDPRALLELLAALDQTSLSYKRRPTLALVRSLFRRSPHRG